VSSHWARVWVDVKVGLEVVPTTKILDPELQDYNFPVLDAV